MVSFAPVRLAGLCALTLLATVLSLAASGVEAQTADALYQDAEKTYAEMSYGTAADLYQALMDKFPGDARVTEAAFKVALCRFKMERYDEAITLLEPYVEAHRESFWAAKARRILVLAYGSSYQRDWEKNEKLLREATDYLNGRLGTAADREELVLCLFDYAGLMEWWAENDAERKARDEKLEAALKRIVEVNASPEFSARATVRLGDFYADRGKPAAAVEKWVSAVKTWPRTAAAPEAQLRLARYYEEKEDYNRALVEYRLVVERWPRSDSAQGAREAAKRIVDPQVSVEFNETAAPGKPITYLLVTRNVKQVRLAAYPTDPAKLFLDLKSGNLLEAPPATTAAKEWTVVIPDPSGHKPYAKALETPVLPPGAYHLVARDRDGAAKTGANVNLTSLILVQAQSPRGELVTWVSRRSDGRAVEGVKLDYRRREWDSDKEVWVAMGGSTTDARGLASTELPDKASSKQMQTLARLGDEVAWVQDAYVYFSREEAAQLAGYVYTDRPVYRPGQTVNYSAVLRTFKGGRPSNLAGKSCTVEIADPRDERMATTELTTNEFGSLHGEFTLEEEPALGMYSVSVRLGDERCGGQFRVEEYKKPEFEVTVTPGGEDFKPGEKASAKIHAEYYFGGPVPGAKVAYTVQRRPYWQWYRFGRPYDWFFLDWEERPDRYYGEGEVVTRGEAVTDAEGNLTVEFDTLADKDRDFQYQVKAEVTDQSRRTIEGSQTIKVTRSSFSLHLNTVQRLYHAADKITVDVKAVTPNDTPVQTTGMLTVYKVTPAEREVESDGEKVKEKYEKREPILPEPLSFTTDAEGLAHITFVPDREGCFEAEAVAEDPRRPEPTKGTKRFWAVNDSFDGENLDYTNLTLETERDVYEKGETARILINAPVKDRDALILIGGRDLLDRQIVKLNGSAKVFELPITDGYIPNITIEAYVVGTDQIYSTQKQLFVPPSEKFLNLTVSSDKPEYRPREKGRFEVTALTKDGQPAKAEVCLAITDESVYYIQSDLVGPIEKFFYARDRGEGIRSWHSWGWEQRWDEDSVRRGYHFAVRYRDGGLGAGEAEAVQSLALAAPREAGRPVAKMAAGVELSEAAPGGAMAEATVRTQFADTCFWGPTLLTGPDGKATAEVEFPDNLTTWRATGRALTEDTRVGQKEAKVRTSKDIIARLQLPRFLVQKDVATISTVAHNYLAQAKNVRVEFAAEGIKLDDDQPETVNIEPNGEVRVDRKVEALAPGLALLTTKALTDVESDAMQLPLPILPHGAEKFVWRAGQVTDEGAETFDFPAERNRESDALVVQITPSLAAGLLEALPYLADYPYGCVEQTMNRFLPSVIVADTAKRLSLNTGERLADVPRMVKAGLRRLYSQQNGDGSWGWWAGGPPNLYMTAYVTSGLLRAKAAGYEVKAEVLDRALGFLKDNVEKEKRPDNLAYVAYVLAQAGEKPEGAVNRVYEVRDTLNDQTRALLAITLKYLRDERAEVVVRNLIDYRIETERGCHWGKDEWGWWWSDDQIEATASSLLALMRVQPESPLIGKTVWWLVTNRRNADHWKSTKDTALAIAALSEYLLASREGQASYTASVYVNDKLVKGIEVTPQNALTVDAKIAVDRALLRDGQNQVRLRKDGGGALYYGLLGTYYTLEEPITGAKSVIAVDRKYYTIEEYVDDKQHLQVKRTPLAGTVKSGTQVEVELTITAENDFDYVMLEDYKPAGCEPVDLRSGYVWSEDVSAYREFRDEKVALFIEHLPQGTHKLTYRMRAEVPGDFHALPSVGKGMYMPDVRCLSDEARVVIG